MTIIYPYLPKGKEIRYLSSDHLYMLEARQVCERHSTVDNQPTGAVVVLNDVVVGRGANQAAIKNKTLRNFHKNGFCVRRFFNVETGTKYWLCPGCANFHNHAEAQAVTDAKRNLKDLEGSDLYLYGHWWCCKPCWDAMLGAGVRHVYLLEGSEHLFSRERTNVTGHTKREL